MNADEYQKLIDELDALRQEQRKRGRRSGVASESKKWDDGKPRYDLIPPKAINEVARVMAYGAHKYGPNTWQALPGANARYFAAAQRHLWAWLRGEEIDPESGLHQSHAAVNCLFLLEIVKTGYTDNAR